MMSKNTLLSYRSTVGKMSHYPSVDRERQLITSHLEALENIDRLLAEVDALKVGTSMLKQDRCDFDCDACREDELD
jgi:hypothetical protein